MVSRAPAEGKRAFSDFVVVDVGNTSTAVGVWRDGAVSNVAHCDGGFEQAVRCAAALPQYPIAYLSVVPDCDAKWLEYARERGVMLHRVTHRDFARRRRGACGEAALTLDYPRPETIGADRLADAAGAVARYGAPVLVMDFGTALTAAIVTGDRVWRGGVIAPGFPLMRDYLFERTARLPKLPLGRGRAPRIGRSTTGAMMFGALVGYRGMVREIVDQLRRNFHEDFRLVATGGFAKWALRDSGMDFTIDPTLTLFGAGLVAQQSIQAPDRRKGTKR